MESASIALGHDHAEEHHGPPEANQSARIDRTILGILLFILSEVMLFGAFFAAYFFLRVVADPAAWPPEGVELPVLIAGINTAVLVSSSFTVHYALEANIRAWRGHFSSKPEDHLGVEVPGIYWHFVDIMWIIVFVAIYVI